MSVDYDALLAKLVAWSDEAGEFHADRQLADECLLATGWSVEPDAAFEGGIRWYFGTNPQVSVGEANRPHVLFDLGTAIGAMPFKWNFVVELVEGRARVFCWPPGLRHMPLNAETGEHRSLNAAALIAAVKAYRARSVGRTAKDYLSGNDH